MRVYLRRQGGLYVHTDACAGEYVYSFTSVETKYSEQLVVQLHQLSKLSTAFCRIILAYVVPKHVPSKTHVVTL